MSFVISQPDTEEEYKQYYHLRWKILRAPWAQPKGSEIDDIENQCFHVMAVTDKKEVIGVARLQFNSKTEAQIRYMAVAKKHATKGIGRALMEAMEGHATKLHYQQIILDAREPAIGFYEKLDYKIINKSYLLFDDIQHFSMKKIL